MISAGCLPTFPASPLARWKQAVHGGGGFANVSFQFVLQHPKASQQNKVRKHMQLEGKYNICCGLLRSVSPGLRKRGWLTKWLLSVIWTILDWLRMVVDFATGGGKNGSWVSSRPPMGGDN